MRKRSNGFSLVELLVSLVIVIVFFTAMMAMFDRSARFNKVEQGVTDSQQNVRFASYQMAREIRMARVGGLAVTNSVIPIFNNAPAGSVFKTKAVGGTDHPVRTNTDAVEIRGVMDSPLFALNPGSFPGSATSASDQTITIVGQTAAGYYNNKALDPCYSRDASNACQQNGPDSFKDFMNALSARDSAIAVAAGAQNATGTYLLPIDLLDTTGNYDVATLKTVNLSSLTASAGQTITLTVNFSSSVAKAYNADGTTAVTIGTPLHAGLIDDLVYFVHDGAEGSETTAVIDPQKTHPVLSVARRYVPLGGGAAVFDVQGLAEDVEDMQVAYGIDAYTGGAPPLTSASPGPDGVVYPQEYIDATTGIVIPSTSTAADEWFPNARSSSATDTITVGGVQYLDSSGSNDIVNAAKYPLMFASATNVLLRALKIAIVAKATNPDSQAPGFRGPGAFGIAVMDDPLGGNPVSTTNPYHRRVIDLAVNMRNFGT
jgi:Tfp pilus assembly protein PilW